MMPTRSFFLAFLVNTLVQVPLLLGGGLLLSRIARSARPVLQYRLWVGVLWLQILLPIASASSWDGSALSRALLLWLASRSGPVSSQITTSMGPVALRSGLSVPLWLWATMLTAYLALTAFHAARLLHAWWQVHNLRHSARSPALSAETWKQWDACRLQFGLTRACIAETPFPSGMMTIGARSQVLLVPPGLLDRLSAEDRTAALAHECAHMQRHDFAWNLLFHCVALPIAFHPCTRRVLNRIAASREMVCDDRAAQVAAGHQRYAKSLLRLAAALLPAPSASALNAIGMLDANTLERRLMRLQQNSSPLRRPQLWAMAATALVAVTGTWTTASALHLGVASPKAQTQAGSPPSLHVNGGVEAGNILSRVNPTYPQEARDAHIVGSVILKAVIDQTGAITDLQVLSGPAELTQSALDAVRKWTYKPYLLNGQPTAVETTITVNYNLN